MIDGAALAFWAARVCFTAALVMLAALLLGGWMYRRNVRQLRAQLKCAKVEGRALRRALRPRRYTHAPGAPIPNSRAVQAAGWLPMSPRARAKETRLLERMFAQPDREPPTEIGAKP